MNMVVQLIKMAAVLIAAIMLGNWFFQEVKSARARQKPWYTPYLTPPRYCHPDDRRCAAAGHLVLAPALSRVPQRRHNR